MVLPSYDGAIYMVTQARDENEVTSSCRKGIGFVRKQHLVAVSWLDFSFLRRKSLDQ